MFNGTFAVLELGRLRDAERYKAIDMIEAELSNLDVAWQMECFHQAVMKLIDRNNNTVIDRERKNTEHRTIIQWEKDSL